jgi:hypothetical protein
MKAQYARYRGGPDSDRCAGVVRMRERARADAREANVSDANLSVVCCGSPLLRGPDNQLRPLRKSSASVFPSRRRPLQKSCRPIPKGSKPSSRWLSELLPCAAPSDTTGRMKKGKSILEGCQSAAIPPGSTDLGGGYRWCRPATGLNHRLHGSQASGLPGRRSDFRRDLKLSVPPGRCTLFF